MTFKSLCTIQILRTALFCLYWELNSTVYCRIHSTLMRPIFSIIFVSQSFWFRGGYDRHQFCWHSVESSFPNLFFIEVRLSSVKAIFSDHGCTDLRGVLEYIKAKGGEVGSFHFVYY